MRISASIIACVAVSTAAAIPIAARAAVTDTDILNYALTLEHLEDTFYRQGLANYTQAQFVAAGFPDPFYANLMEVASDEKTHVAFLTSALGSAAVAECTYNFPSTTPAEFVALASVLEGVGVTAYLGAAASIANHSTLTAAGSILTIESRHNAIIRGSLQQNPFPQAFDVPLSLDEVFSLAAPFIASCPSTNAALPVKAFPPLALGTTGVIKSGSTISLLTPTAVFVSATGSPLYIAFITVTGPIFGVANAVPGGFTTVVPAGVNGQSYAVLTGSNQGLSDETVAAGPAIIEITN